MKKYEIVSSWGCTKIEAEDDKTRRELIEEFLDQKVVEYIILDEQSYGQKKQLTQFQITIDGKGDELEIILQ